MRIFLFTLLLSSTLGSAQGAPCNAGQSIGPDTQGHCCWSGQMWSTARSTCIGIPTTCPAGQVVEGEACVTRCPAGQAVGPETQGQCCWPGQMWSSSRSRCIGIPTCAAPLVAEGESCVTASCPAGQVQNADTQGHCCWPNQIWSGSRSTCIGTPACPSGLTATGTTCTAAPATPPPAPSTSAPAPATAPASGTVKVLFKGDSGGEGSVPEYDVTLLDDRGARVERCKTPCVMNVPPKTYGFKARGTGHFNGTIDLAGPSDVSLRYKEQLGVVLMGVPAGIGVATAIFGGLAIGKGEDTPLAWAGLLGGSTLAAGAITGAIIMGIKINSVEVKVKSLSVALLPGGGVSLGGSASF